MAHPYTAWRLAEEHRNDLLRTAEEWRLVHPATVDETTPLSRHTLLSRLLATPFWIARPLVLRSRSRHESTTALFACSCPPRR